MTLFKDAAKYYKYRVEYPESLLQYIKDKLSLDGKTNLLDIGAGEGRLSISLGKYFKEVFAVDIDNGMLEEGRRKVELLGVQNIKWICRNGEDLKSENFKDIQVVSFANSLHWFDQDKVLKFVYELLPDDGAAVIVGGTTIWREAPEPWQQKTLETIKKYLGPDRLTVNGKFQKPKYKFGDSLKVAGFNRIERHNFDFTPRVLTAEDVVNLQFSTSYAAPELFKDKLNDFTEELMSELLKINPNNKFEEEDGGTVVIAWKK
jgi:ubiquinone/menaquinone biosynthesis C-methylase UbiE